MGDPQQVVVLNRKNNLDKNLNVFKTGSEVLIIDNKTISISIKILLSRYATS